MRTAFKLTSYGVLLRLQRQRELRAAIEQKGDPTFFFTFSCADNHWADLHAHMPTSPITAQARRKAALENSHVVDAYFSLRLEAMAKRFFDQMLDADWRWYRFEWQARTAIHAHGIAKLKNDPGLVNLTEKVYAGVIADKLLDANAEMSAEELQRLREAVRVGQESKKRVLSYVDTLICCWNLRDPSQFSPVVPDPHPASIYPPGNLRDGDAMNADLEELSNCLQRHVCKLNGYCYSAKHSGCRFGFPKQPREQSDLIFEETAPGVVTAKLLLKQNEAFMNPYVPAILQCWRANMDIQIIVDIDACVRYS